VTVRLQSSVEVLATWNWCEK